MAAAAARTSRIDLERNPELGWVELAGREGESGRHHANHVARAAVEEDIASHSLGVACVGALPEAIGDYRGLGNAGTVVFGGERAAQNRRYAEQGQHPAGDKRSGGAHGLAGAGQVDSLVDPRFHSIPGVRVAL
jgi:hypothetical protein